MALTLRRIQSARFYSAKITLIKEGDLVKRSGRHVCPVGEACWEEYQCYRPAYWWKSPINSTESRIVDVVAPGIIWQAACSSASADGIKAVDAMIPLEEGRESLSSVTVQVGKRDRHWTPYINQKGGRRFMYICCYSQKLPTFPCCQKARRQGALEHTIIVQQLRVSPLRFSTLLPIQDVTMGE